MLDELESLALLGTRGSPIRLPALPDDLAGALPKDSSSAESQLLDVAAAATLYSRAGARARPDISRPELSRPDQRSECTARATDILAQALDERLEPIVAEWCRLANDRELRPPHYLLPKLLNAAATRRALRSAAAAVVDERGRWLMQFNAGWQFSRRPDESPDEAWQTGNRQQRTEALRAVRQSDPARARMMVADTWKHDGAEERTDWLDCLRSGLSDADEEFLESCLDDRSGKVREAAADLLAQLPNSKFVRRMVERILALVIYHPGSAGSLLKLKRPTKPRLEITLPESFDKSLERDGITEKPEAGIGPKQWWLLQMVGYVPLDHWTQAFGGSPAEIVEAVPAEYATVFVRGWLAALPRRPVVEWIEPLVAAAGNEVRLEPADLRLIPPSHRAVVLRAVLSQSKRIPTDLMALIESWTPLEKSVSTVLLDDCETRLLVAHDLYFHLHSETLAALEARLTDSTEERAWRRKIDQALAVIGLRRELHKEFSHE